MKLNFIQRNKEKNLKEKQSNEKKCYSYDKLNYFAKNCRSKNMMLRRQINTLLKIFEARET